MKNVLKVIGILLVLRVVFHLLRGARHRRRAGRRGLGYGRFGQGGPVAVDGQPAGPAAGFRQVVPVG